jgi:hypothetical protein
MPNKYLFSLSATAKHPRLTAEAVCAMLEWSPFNAWSVGDPRTTPAGTKLPGARDDTMCVIRHEYIDRNFAEHLEEMVKALQRKSAELDEFLGTGGSLSIRLGLNGRENLADALSPELLANMGTLGITFLIEAFPNG